MGNVSSELKILLFFTVAALITTYPVALHMFDSVPGWAGDPMVFFFSLWWYGIEGFGFIFKPTVPYIFHPFGVPYHAYGDLAPINIFLLPVIHTLGPVFTYNLSILLSFVLSGYFAYLLGREFTGSRRAGILSGVFFSFSAYHFSRMIGHLNLVHIEWFPLIIFAVKKAMDTQRMRYFILAGMSFVLLFLSSGYYAYIGGLTVLLFVFLYGRWTKKGLPIVPTIVAIGIPAMVLSPFIFNIIKLKAVGMLKGSIGWTYIHSADIMNYLWYNPRSALFGNAVLEVPLKTSIPTEQALYLGIVPLVLAAFAIRTLFFSKKEKLREFALPIRTFAIIGIAFLILSLGPVLKWNNEMVLMPVSGAKQILLTASQIANMGGEDRERMAELSGVPVPMPYLLPYFVFPYFSMMRVPSRLGVVAYLSLAVLAGIGYSAIERDWKKNVSNAVFVIALIAYFVEVMPSPFPMIAPVERPVDAWLAGQEGTFAIVEYPVSIYDCDYLGHIPFHKKPIVNFCSSFIPQNAPSTVDTLDGFPPSGEALEFFMENDVKYILVDYSESYQKVEYIGSRESVPGLDFVGKFGDVYVYTPAA